MSTRDQGEQGKDTDEVEDTEGHLYVPKDERAGGIAGLPGRKTSGRRMPIEDEDQLRF